MPNVSYTGIHCEVGMHVVIKDRKIIKSFEANVANIKNKKQTIQVK